VRARRRRRGVRKKKGGGGIKLQTVRFDIYIHIRTYIYIDTEWYLSNEVGIQNEEKFQAKNVEMVLKKYCVHVLLIFPGSLC
jgi:hypothetical protein